MGKSWKTRPEIFPGRDKDRFSENLFILKSFENDLVEFFRNWSVSRSGNSKIRNIIFRLNAHWMSFPEIGLTQVLEI